MQHSLFLGRKNLLPAKHRLRAGDGTRMARAALFTLPLLRTRVLIAAGFIMQQGLFYGHWLFSEICNTIVLQFTYELRIIEARF